MFVCSRLLCTTLQFELKMLFFFFFVAVIFWSFILQLVLKCTVCSNFHTTLTQWLFCVCFCIVVTVWPRRGGWEGDTAAKVQSVLQYLTAVFSLMHFIIVESLLQYHNTSWRIYFNWLQADWGIFRSSWSMASLERKAQCIITTHLKLDSGVLQVQLQKASPLTYHRVLWSLRSPISSPSGMDRWIDIKAERNVWIDRQCAM